MAAVHHLPSDELVLDDEALAHDVDGLPEKRKDTPYRSDRFDGWRKIKCLDYKRQDE